MVKKIFIFFLLISLTGNLALFAGEDLFSTEIVPNASSKLPGSFDLPSSAAQSPEPVVRIISNENLCAAIEVNGKPLPPVTNVMAHPDATETADLIVKLNRLGVRFFEFDLQSFEFCREPGKYDFSVLDKRMRRVLNLAPDAYVILAIRFNNTYEYLKYMPDEGIGYATGPANQPGDQLRRFPSCSMASEPFRKLANDMLDTVCKYIKKQPWGKRIIGFRVSYGVYSEWHYYGMAGDMPDTGKAMTKAFRAYLRELYKNDKALQKAWHNQKVTLETAQVPDKDTHMSVSSYLRNPGNYERQILDYYRCLQRVVADLLLSMAKQLKTHFPDRIVGAYYGYNFKTVYSPTGITSDVDRVLESPYIDFLASPYPYDGVIRNAGGSGMARSLYSTTARYGKLSLLDADIRTQRAIGKDRNLISAKTPEEERAVMLRDFANMYFYKSGIQIHHVCHFEGQPCWFNTREMLRAIHDGIKKWEEIFHQKVPFAANEIAVVCNGREATIHGYPTRYQQWGLYYLLHDAPLLSLYRSGYSFDLMSLTDFIASRHKYKAVYFMNAFTLTDAERKALKAKLSPDQHIIWVFAPGIMTENAFSDAAMKDLTGLNLKHKLGNFLLEAVYDAERVGKRTLKIGKKPLYDALRVYADEPGAEVLARYSDDQKPAVIRKAAPEGGSVSFFGFVPTRHEEIDLVLSRAGVHRFRGAGRFLHYQEPYLLFSVNEAKSWIFDLPKKARRITDVFSGEVIAEDCSKFTITAKNACTWLLKIEY